MAIQSCSIFFCLTFCLTVSVFHAFCKSLLSTHMTQAGHWSYNSECTPRIPTPMELMVHIPAQQRCLIVCLVS